MNGGFALNALGFSHRFMSEHIKSGGVCIDATAGRGRDTAFLCSLVGNTGKVFAFDIQEAAIKETRELLKSEGYSDTVTLIRDCHSNMGRYLKPLTVDGIMFNLGRLPFGDPNIFSMPETTIRAVEEGLKLLKPKGVMSICIYCGKENGYDEKNELLGYIKTIDNKQFEVITLDFPNRKGDFPIPVFIIKN